MATGSLGASSPVTPLLKTASERLSLTLRQELARPHTESFWRAFGFPEVAGDPGRILENSRGALWVASFNLNLLRRFLQWTDAARTGRKVFTAVRNHGGCSTFSNGSRNTK